MKKAEIHTDKGVMHVEFYDNDAPNTVDNFIKLAKSGHTASEIGLILRDTYGIHSVSAVTGRKITAILRDNKLTKELPDDLMALIVKFLDVKKHLDKNKQDKTAKRGLQLTDSKIRRLMKYYKKTKKLPADWKFDHEKVKMYVE